MLALQAPAHKSAEAGWWGRAAGRCGAATKGMSGLPKPSKTRQDGGNNKAVWVVLHAEGA